MRLFKDRERAGWLQALLAVVVFMALSNVFGRYGAHIYQIQPVVFSCAAFASCAFALLFFAGRGPLGQETMRSIDTWAYGTVLMLNYILSIHLFFYVSSTEGSMLQKLSILFAVVGSWFFLSRKPDVYQIIGTAITTIGVLVVFLGIREDKGIVLTLAILFALLQALRMFIAELHRPHTVAMQATRTLRDRARVVGFVMFTMSCIFTGFSVFIGWMQTLSGVSFMNGLPMLADFTHPPSLFMGLIGGVLIIAPLRMLEFSSSNIIKAENFATIAAFSVVATFFWEWITSSFTGLSVKTVSGYDLVAAGLITFGAVFVARTRGRAARKVQFEKYLIRDIQAPKQVQESRDIIAVTLEHFSGDIKKTAHALKLPEYIIKAMLDDTRGELALKKLDDISRRFRRHVSGSDSLTGLLNRAAFNRMAAQMLNDSNDALLLYMDLDKFKPVNDTYGHEAGDRVLQLSAKRLQEALPKDALIARLGGDEYCALVPDRKKAAGLCKQIADTLQQAIKLENGEEVSVGCSVGLAHHPRDGQTLAELIRTADGEMYGVKKAR